MSNNTQLAVQQVCGTLKNPEFQKQIRDALPAGVTIDRFTRVTLTAIQQNPSILDGVDRQSFYNAVVRAAQDGLYPDGREAAIVKYGTKAQYMPMIGGIRKVLAKHGIALASGVICENDHFSYELGVVPVMHHIPAKLGQPRGDAIGAWAQARDVSGHIYLEVMSKDEIEKVRAVSRSAKSGPWVDWWSEQARKTVAKRLAKQLPLYEAEDVASVVEADNAHFTVGTPAQSETLGEPEGTGNTSSVRDRMGITDESESQDTQTATDAVF